MKLCLSQPTHLILFLIIEGMKTKRIRDSCTSHSRFMAKQFTIFFYNLDRSWVYTCSWIRTKINYYQSSINLETAFKTSHLVLVHSSSHVHSVVYGTLVILLRAIIFSLPSLFHLINTDFFSVFLLELEINIVFLYEYCQLCEHFDGCSV